MVGPPLLPEMPSRPIRRRGLPPVGTALSWYLTTRVPGVNCAEPGTMETLFPVPSSDQTTPSLPGSVTRLRSMPNVPGRSRNVSATSMPDLIAEIPDSGSDTPPLRCRSIA